MTTYRTWEDLDEPPAPAPGPITSGANAGGPTLTGRADEIAGLGAPTELVDLLRRKEELEAQLRQFATGEQTPEDERRAKCFPVKVHTKESRIEDRRIRRRDEQLAMLNQRSLERARLDRVRAELARQARLRQLEASVLSRLDAERRENAQRQALEQATLARRRNAEQELERELARQEAERLSRAEVLAAARREHQIAEDDRLAAERDALLVRWQAALKSALAATRAEREQRQVALDRNERLRRDALTRRAAETRATRAEHERLEIDKRAAECRLRSERSAEARAEHRAFLASRDGLSRNRRREPASTRER